MIAEPLTPRARQPIRSTNPDLARFAAELDERVTERGARIAQHAVTAGPLWAVRALGPVPEDEARRADWQLRAGRLGAWREFAGTGDADALGPRPPTTFPEKRAAWQRAAIAAIKTIAAARLALRGDGQHHVSLDKAIKTRRETEADMQDKYEETARAGLALNVVEC